MTMKQVIEDAKWFIEESMKFMNKPRWWVLLHPIKIIKFCLDMEKDRWNMRQGYCESCSHEEE